MRGEGGRFEKRIQMTLEELQKQAADLISKQKFQEAIDLLSKYIPEIENHAGLLTERARAYIAQKKNDDALVDLNEALKLAPFYSTAYFYRGNAWQDAQVELTIDDYSSAIRFHKDFVEALVNRGIVLARDKQEYDLAIQDFTEAIHALVRRQLKEPLDQDECDIILATIYFQRADVYSFKNEIIRGINDYTECIKLDSSFLPAYFNRGNLYTRNQQFELAIKDYSKVIDSAPTFINSAHLARSNAYYYTERYDEAIENCKYVINSDAKENEKAIAYYLTAVSHFEKKIILIPLPY